MGDLSRASLLLLLVTAGCGAGWRRVDPAPATLPPRQQVSIDSIRVGNMERGAYKSIGVTLLGMTALAGILYYTVDHD